MRVFVPEASRGSSESADMFMVRSADLEMRLEQPSSSRFPKSADNVARRNSQAVYPMIMSDEPVLISVDAETLPHGKQ